MDISALPNNNHPEKFLQLDVGMLPATRGLFQVGAAVSGHKHWQNRVYSQRRCSRGEGAAEEKVQQRRWCSRGDGAAEEMVQQRRRCSRGEGAAEEKVQQRRRCSRGEGAAEEKVQQRRRCSRCQCDSEVQEGQSEQESVIETKVGWKLSLSSQRGQRVKTAGWSPASPEAPPVAFEDRYLGKHITPVTLKANIKRNPLFIDMRAMEAVDNRKTKPSWTVREYDTQSAHGNLAHYLKEEASTPRDLDFWLEDLYTPGFDSLLKKKQAEHKRKKLCKIVSLIVLSVCAILIVIIVPVVLLQKQN
ncbi:major intrinsically disordered NOTCH2-binding receptor 1-like homolog [Pungitius pungitius]|uniref:major intrinsically disordered NOTCH2-binding receptor 1-like homolog n=1 Tax=Pungitius pungitius TaxID=134920 RepID=UPI002E15CA7F